MDLSTGKHYLVVSAWGLQLLFKHGGLYAIDGSVVRCNGSHQVGNSAYVDFHHISGDLPPGVRYDLEKMEYLRD